MADSSKPSRHDTDVVGGRVIAQVIDLFTMLGIFFIIMILFGFTGGILSALTGSGESVVSAFTTMGMITGGLIVLGYSFILEAFWNGQTVGKRLFGIKVVKEDGSKIDTGSALVRNIPAIASLSWFVYLVALLSMAASDKRQRLFDRLAGTVVVKEDF